ncbi:MAG: hypothetical protein AB7G13_00200 [Lautropia sp.]
MSEHAAGEARSAAAFAALLDRAGLLDLDAGDRAFLRAAFDRTASPLPIPEGFDELQRPMTASAGLQDGSPS